MAERDRVSASMNRERKMKEIVCRGSARRNRARMRITCAFTVDPE